MQVFANDPEKLSLKVRHAVPLTIQPEDSVAAGHRPKLQIRHGARPHQKAAKAAVWSPIDLPFQDNRNRDFGGQSGQTTSTRLRTRPTVDRATPRHKQVWRVPTGVQ